MKEASNKPRLRFPEFSSEWSEVLFGDIASFSKGKGISKNDIVENGNLACIRYGELYTDYSEVIQDVNSSTNLKSSDLVLSEENDVIIPASGETQIDIATASCVVKKGIALGGDLNIIKSPTNGIFLAYYLNDKKKYDIARLAQGISVVHLYGSQLKQLKLCLPSEIEQTKIAKFLTTVDKRIKILTQQKEKLEQYKKGVMQQIFNQQIRFKNENGNDFPEWDEKKLGEVYEIVGGGTPETTKKEYWNGTIEWFTPTEIKSKYIESSDRKITQNGLQKSSAKLLPKGTLLFTSRATIGDVGFCSKECCTNQGFQSFVPNEKNEIEFLYYWILKNRKEFIRRSSGSTFLEISKKEIQKIKLFLPSLKEQQKIASFLSALDNKIELVSQQIEQTTTWKKGLLQKMFE
uniref:restriction endonuclease subunit S n=1 Tax=uncultured Draconibacterium sp. TaxID=1573823 RepID=UPI0032180E12